VRPSPVPETDDPARAARRLMTDDGMNLGVLYRGSRPTYPLARVPDPVAPDALATSFAV